MMVMMMEDGKQMVFCFAADMDLLRLVAHRRPCALPRGHRTAAWEAIARDLGRRNATARGCRSRLLLLERKDH